MLAHEKHKKAVCRIKRQTAELAATRVATCVNTTAYTQKFIALADSDYLAEPF